MTSAPEIEQVTTVRAGQPDDLLIVAASWEQRCLGLPQRLSNYKCAHILMTEYDGVSAKRAENIEKLRAIFHNIAPVKVIEATHANPLRNVRETVAFMRGLKLRHTPRITFDVSTFTRKHLLQLLQGLDSAGVLGDCHIYHTEPKDFHTQDNEPIAEGVSSIKAIETFGGEVRPSRDSLLILFLGYEGRRALALFENLEPNRTLAVVAHPPYRENWAGRTEAQNRFLLSCLSHQAVYRSHSLVPESTEALLQGIANDPAQAPTKFNYFIGPLGTKAQIVGIYRYWRLHRGEFTIIYASPVRYREERADYPPGRTWLIDRTEAWPALNPPRT